MFKKLYSWPESGEPMAAEENSWMNSIRKRPRGIDPEAFTVIVVTF